MIQSFLVLILFYLIFSQMVDKTFTRAILVLYLPLIIFLLISLEIVDLFLLSSLAILDTFHPKFKYSTIQQRSFVLICLYLI